MKRVPSHFTCRSRETGEWNTCSKQYICELGLTRDEYRPDTEDYDYIDNWQSQVDMLCEPKTRIGLLGALYFVGILVASTVIPVGYISDQIGRKLVYCATIIVQITACLGLLFATEMDHLYIFLFMFGLTFPGRIIVGQSYAYEFITERW